MGSGDDDGYADVPVEFVFYERRIWDLKPRADLVAYVVDHMLEFAYVDAKARAVTVTNVVDLLEIGDRTGEKPPWVAKSESGNQWETDRNAAWMTAWTIEKVKAAWDRRAARVTDAEIVEERVATDAELRGHISFQDALGNIKSTLLDPWHGASKRDRAFGLARQSGVMEPLIEYMRKNHDPEFPDVGPPKQRDGVTFKPERDKPADVVMRMACHYYYDVLDAWFELYDRKTGNTARTRPGGEDTPVPIGPTALEIAALWWCVDAEKLRNRLKKLTRKALGRIKGVVRR